MKLVLSSTHFMEDKKPSRGDSLILDSAKKRGLDTKIIDPSKISYHFDNKNLRVYADGEDISDSDIVLIRRTRGAELESYQFARAMEAKYKVVVDPSEALIYPVSKLAPQILRVSEYTPKTIFVPSFSDKTLEEIAKTISFPLVIKPTNQTKKRGFQVAQNIDDVMNYFKNVDNNSTIFQEYLDIVASMRVLTLGDKVVGSVYCTGTKDLSGLEKAELITQEVIRNNPVKILGSDVVRTSQGKYFVLECNRNPDFTLMQNKDNPYAGKIVDYLIEVKEKGFEKKELKIPRDESGLKRFLRKIFNLN